MSTMVRRSSAADLAEEVELLRAARRVRGPRQRLAAASRALIRLDLPTLERPAKAISWPTMGGRSSTWVEAQTKSPRPVEQLAGGLDLVSGERLSSVASGHDALPTRPRAARRCRRRAISATLRAILLGRPVPPADREQLRDDLVVEARLHDAAGIADDDRIGRHVARTTCARVPMIAPSPIVTPGMITASRPIQTSLPITVSPRCPCRRAGRRRGALAEAEHREGIGREAAHRVVGAVHDELRRLGRSRRICR